jgi:hypothetical protein
MIAYGKPIIAGMSVSLKANPKQTGKILRIYPFTDKPNIMVRWDNGAGIRSFNIGALRV